MVSLMVTNLWQTVRKVVYPRVTIVSVACLIVLCADLVSASPASTGQERYDLGGPCAFAHQASSADEIIKAQDKHLREMVAGGDHTHTNALDEMKRRWRRPISAMVWYRTTKREFAARPEQAEALPGTEGPAT